MYLAFIKEKIGILGLLLALSLTVVQCSNTNDKTNESASKSTESIEVESNTNKVADASKNDKTIIEIDESQDNSKEKLTVDNIKESVNLGLEEDDTINDINIDGDKITINVKLGDPTPLTEKDLAVSRFGSI